MLKTPNTNSASLLVIVKKKKKNLSNFYTQSSSRISAITSCEVIHPLCLLIISVVREMKPGGL